MDEKTNIKSDVVAITLTDVMYAVVLAYGFNLIDQANDFSDYFRFVFAYMVLVVDWIYTHQLYPGWKYNKNFMTLDVIILFVISRLLFASTVNNSYYFFWFSILFILYVVWAIAAKITKRDSQYDWRYCIASNSFGSITFLALWILSTKRVVQIENPFWIVSSVFVYIIIVLSWFKENPKRSRPMTNWKP